MNDQAVKRTLAAIVMADVVGYSRMMGEDEAGTLRRLTQYRSDFIDPTITKHRGRLVNAIGDSLLLEFGSVIDATLCAIALQQAISDRNAPLTGTQTHHFSHGGEYRRCHRSESKPFRRQRQCRGEVAGARRAWRDLPFRRRLRTSSRQDRSGLRGHRPASGQEHRPARRDVRPLRAGHRGNPQVFAARAGRARRSTAMARDFRGRALPARRSRVRRLLSAAAGRDDRFQGATRLRPFPNSGEIERQGARETRRGLHRDGPTSRLRDRA